MHVINFAIVKPFIPGTDLSLVHVVDIIWG